jgi:hypothetical protein
VTPRIRKVYARAARSVTLPAFPVFCIAILDFDSRAGDSMTITDSMRAVASAAAAFGFVIGLAAAAAQADECEAMTKAVKTVIDKFDPAAKGGNNEPRLCAAYAEGLGLMKSFRIVTDECLDEGDERTKALAGLDRSIRTLQTQVDKNCD